MRYFLERGLFVQKYINFVNEFENKLQDLKEGYSNIIFLCIGSGKIIGDSIGPFIGKRLKEVENEIVQVYGTTDNMVNFVNAKEIIESIYSSYEKPYLINVDSTLSNSRGSGDIVLEKGYIKLGKALNKTICFYSNVNIKCIVGKNYNQITKNLEELNNVKLPDIVNMSSIVTYGIKKVLQKVDVFV